MAVSVPRLKIRLFNSTAEGQQVAVGLDLLAELIGGEARSQDCEEVTKHQRVQLGRPLKGSHDMCVGVRIVRLVHTGVQNICRKGLDPALKFTAKM